MVAFVLFELLPGVVDVVADAVGVVAAVLILSVIVVFVVVVLVVFVVLVVDLDLDVVAVVVVVTGLVELQGQGLSPLPTLLTHLSFLGE